METHLADFIRDTPDGREAEAILRACVHCGFCTATCPTYQLTGDELDGPRGRIYLIKQLLEGKPAGATTRYHLDRCLVCRACETTCPSGVTYHRLLDIGREVLSRRQPRGALASGARTLLREGLARPAVFGGLLAGGRALRALLPAALAQKIPAAAAPTGAWPAARHARRMLVLQGCAQSVLAPAINVAAARVLDAAGISLVTAPGAGCCGALRFHTDGHDGGLDDMRALIDRWSPACERGEVEAIVVTASGCGAHIRDYGKLLAHDARYAGKAQRIAEMARDISEVVAAEADRLRPHLAAPGAPVRVAFHSPCTLQHGLRIRGVVERLLVDAGCTLTPVPDGHLCCGSAGTYALLQPAMSGRLREAKLTALASGDPQLILSANIGCLTQLSGGPLPVRHWIEWLAERLC